MLAIIKKFKNYINTFSTIHIIGKIYLQKCNYTIQSFGNLFPSLNIYRYISANFLFDAMQYAIVF